MIKPSPIHCVYFSNIQRCCWRTVLYIIIIISSKWNCKEKNNISINTSSHKNYTEIKCILFAFNYDVRTSDFTSHKWCWAIRFSVDSWGDLSHYFSNSLTLNVVAELCCFSLILCICLNSSVQFYWDLFVYHLTSCLTLTWFWSAGVPWRQITMLLGAWCWLGQCFWQHSSFLFRPESQEAIQLLNPIYLLLLSYIWCLSCCLNLFVNSRS